MDDKEVLGRINDLAREEHELFERESHGKVTDADRARLRRLDLEHGGSRSRWTSAGTCCVSDGHGGRRASTRTTRGFATRKRSRDTRPDA